MLNLNIPRNRKFHKNLKLLILCSVSYWIYIFFINQYSGIPSNLWAITSSIIAFVVPGYVITTSYENQQILILQKAFVVTVGFFCFAHIIQLVSSLPCSTITFSNLGSRQYGYSVCLSGSVMLGNRLTGIGGEPGVFAVEIVVALLLGARLRVNTSIRIAGMLIFIFGLFSTYASTGYASIAVVIISYILKKYRNEVFLNLVLLIAIYPTTNYFSKVLIKRKIEDAPLSISERGLDISFSEYLENWLNHPFGNPNRMDKMTSINLLTNSFYYGFLVLVIFATLIFFLYTNGPRSFTYQTSLLVVSFTVIFSQPPFLNTLWFILILLSGEKCKSRNTS